MRWWGLIILAWMGWSIVMDVLLVRDIGALRLQLTKLTESVEILRHKGEA